MGSWVNAGKITLKDGVGPCPGKPNSKVVISSTHPGVYEVRCFTKKDVRLYCDSDCPMYAKNSMCAHTLAAAFNMGSLDRYLEFKRPSMSSVIKQSIPQYAGEKENEKRNKQL